MRALASIAVCCLSIGAGCARSRGLVVEVRDEHGGPISNAAVEVVTRKRLAPKWLPTAGQCAVESTTVASGRTNEEGEALLGAAPTGPYAVRVSPAEQGWPGVELPRSGPEPLRVTVGPARTVSGNVIWTVDPRCEGTPKLTVAEIGTAEVVPGCGSERSTVASGDGRFTLGPLAPVPIGNR